MGSSTTVASEHDTWKSCIAYIQPLLRDGMVKVVVDAAKCVGNTEKICVEICPVSVFRGERSAKPEVVNDENCTLCRICQVNCPSQAIEIST